MRRLAIALALAAAFSAPGIAQDAAKSPVGQSMLTQGPTGLAIEPRAGLGVALAFLELDAEAAQGDDGQVRAIVEGLHVVGFGEGIRVDAVELLAGVVGGVADLGEVGAVLGAGGTVAQPWKPPSRRSRSR